MIGKILGGRYELLEEVGKGGMAVVYKAKCLLLNRIVAVKVLRTELGENQEFLNRFNVEAQAAASLSNPNIVSVYDVGEENGIHYIVMEYVEGVPLKEYIKRMGRLSWQETVKIAIEICKGLAAAHAKNIIHRDIKPQNIIVTNTGAIKVADFGIARAATTSTMTAENDVLGSVYYFSPEQARGGFVDTRTDIYSLGVVMYEMLTGHVPYDGDSPVAIAMKHIENTPASITAADPSVPASVESIVFKAMQKDTSRRYQTITEMERDLVRVISDPRTSIYHETPDNDIEKTRKMAPVNIPESRVEEIENKDEKSNKKTIILAIVTSLIFVSILSAIAISFLKLGGSGKDKILVPLFVGMTIEEAEAKADSEGFGLEIAGYKDSNEDEDVVLEQKPRENQVVTEKGSVVKITLSRKADEKFALDDFKNKDANTVKSQLEKMGIKVKIETQKNDNIDEGKIIKQSPQAGKKVSKGDTVTLYVSGNDEDEKQVPVPRLVGKTKAQAEKLLKEAGLVLGKVSHSESDLEKDTVISQGLTGFVNEGTKINIVLSSGKEEKNDHTSPSTPGTTTPSTPSTPTQKSKTLSVDLSQYSSPVKIDIVSNGKTVHSSTHDPSQSPMFSATLTGSGTTSFDIYINGQKVGTRAINFDN